MRTDTGQVVNLADYRPTDFVLERVDLTFELDPTETKVEARLIFHRREGADTSAPLILDGDELTLTSLLVDQNEMAPERYTATPESLTIRDLPESQRMAWRAVFDYFVFKTAGEPMAHIPPHAQGALGPMTEGQRDFMKRVLLDGVQQATKR